MNIGRHDVSSYHTWMLRLWKALGLGRGAKLGYQAELRSPLSIQIPFSSRYLNFKATFTDSSPQSRVITNTWGMALAYRYRRCYTSYTASYLLQAYAGIVILFAGRRRRSGDTSSSNCICVTARRSLCMLGQGGVPRPARGGFGCQSSSAPCVGERIASMRTLGGRCR